MRSRNIKPGFYKNEQLAECSFEARLLFPGLWMLSDREGRLENRPKKIKAEVFPFDNVNAELLLDELESNGLILRYSADGGEYIQIITFVKHQMPHHKELSSVIPAPPGVKQQTRHQYDVPENIRQETFGRDGNRCLRCGTTENLSLDHIIPLSKGGDNSINNLQTLCKRCNSSKGGATKDFRRFNVDPTLLQRKTNDGAPCRTDSLIPDSLNLIPESTTPPPTACAREASDDPVSMTPDWTPSEHFAVLAETSGLVPPERDDLDSALGEFKAYWMTQKRKRTPHEWDLAFVKAIKSGFNSPRGRPNGGNGPGGGVKAVTVRDVLTLQNDAIARALNEDDRRRAEGQRPGIVGGQEGCLLLEPAFSVNA